MIQLQLNFRSVLPFQDSIRVLIVMMQPNVNMDFRLTSDLGMVSFFHKESSDHIVLQHHLA